MIPVTVLVQEQQIAHSLQSALEGFVDRFTVTHFGAHALLEWREVAAGSGFTAAEPSTCVVITVFADRHLEPGERQRLTLELGEFAMKCTYRTRYEVIVTIEDPCSEDAHGHGEV